MDDQKIEEYTSKLKRYLANPSSTMEFYETFKADRQEVSFEEYNSTIEDLISRLEEKKISDEENLCREVKKLKLPHNQFGC